MCIYAHIPITDILATVLARKSARIPVSVSVSAPWNVSLKLQSDAVGL